MGSLNFPINPTVGQAHTVGSITWVWNGYAWARYVAPSAALSLGTPSVGTLVDNNPAIMTWTPSTLVVDAVDGLNELLGKLIPPAPPTFPGTATLTISTLPATAMRITNFTQTNNTISGSKQQTAGTSLTNYKRAAAYVTSQIANVGPGTTGTVSVMLNGVSVGSRDIVAGTANGGTYGALTISNNVDYGTVTGKTTGFWTCFTASAGGLVPSGWNEVYIKDTVGTGTNAAIWYYDASTPGTPVIVQSTFVPSTVSIAYSSGVPHYTSAAVWTFNGTVNRLSGDMYPSSDTFLTGAAGGVFAAPASLTYFAASIAAPLARNLYVASGSANISTTVGINNATSSGTIGPSASVDNGYSVGSLTFTPSGTVLTINTSDTTKPNENNIVVGTFGSGGASSAVRVGSLAASATPATSGISTWNSSNAIAVSDATIVAGVIKNDKTNYSTGYFPVGPNLTGQANTQYITFRIARAATSKFNISLTGKITGCYVALPGSSINTTAAATNGWITPTIAYAGAGVPGASGNGSTGCGLGGIITTGSLLTQNVTVTFGTESSSNSTNNYIYVRFILGTGDTITSLSFPNPTN